MVAHPLIYSSGIAGVVAITGATETAVATCAGVTTPYAGQTLKLSGRVLLTTGADQASVKVRIRRQSVTGTLVSDATAQTIITAGGDTNEYGATAIDVPGDVTGYTYVLTVQQVGGVNDAATVYAQLDVRAD